MQYSMKIFTIFAMAAMMVFAACGGDDDGKGKVNYAPGTSGLVFELIDAETAYSVSKGTVTEGVVTIPAYYLDFPRKSGQR